MRGAPARFLISKGVNVTYEGAFTTGDPAYTFQQIPDIHGNLRQGIIFTLITLCE